MNGFNKTQKLKIVQWNGKWHVMGPGTTILHSSDDREDVIRTLVNWQYSDYMFKVLCEMDNDKAIEMCEIIDNEVSSWIIQCTG